MFNFEKLSTWQKAIVFADMIYSCARQFPSTERYGITSQICRAAVSISSNIAEGSSRRPGDFKRFLSITEGSNFEVVSRASIALRQGFLSKQKYILIYDQAEGISRMLSGLRGSLKED